MNDSFGDGWNGAIYTLTNVDGTEIGTGTIEAELRKRHLLLGKWLLRHRSHWWILPHRGKLEC